MVERAQPASRPASRRPRPEPNPVARGVLGASAGFGLWVAAWMLHAIVAPHHPVLSDPVFWMLGTAPLWTASLGWALSDRERLEHQTHTLQRASEHIAAQVASKEAIAGSVLHDSHDAVLIGGIGGAIVDANEPAAALFGVELAELPNMRVAQILPQIPADDTFLESGQTPGGQARVEWRTRARHGNGQVFDVDVRLSRIDSATQVYTIRSVARPEPDGRKVAESRRRGSLLQHVGMSMRHRIDHLLNHFDLGPTNAPLADVAVRLLADLDQLEQVVLWDRGSMHPTIAPLEPAEILRRVVADLQPLARLRRNQIDVHVGEQLDPVIADPVQLVCALRTLVSHELHRAEDCVLRLELVREPGRGSDWMALFVEYPARELSLDQIEAILAGFERATDPHPPDGALLPLALAQRLAKSMGGHVAVESVPGAGTALAMRVPFDVTKVKAVPSRAPPPMMLTPEPADLWPPGDLAFHTPSDLQ